MVFVVEEEEGEGERKEAPLNGRVDAVKLGFLFVVVMTVTALISARHENLCHVGLKFFSHFSLTYLI